MPLGTKHPDVHKRCVYAGRQCGVGLAVWRLRRWRGNKHLHTLVDNGGGGGDGKDNGTGWMRSQLALSTCRARGLRVCVVVVHVVGTGLHSLVRGHFPIPPAFTGKRQTVKMSRSTCVCATVCVFVRVCNYQRPLF